MLTVNAASGFGSGGGAAGRADVGDAPQTNLIYHWRADTEVTEATGVSNWGNQVDTNDLVQGTGANQPSYDATETVGSLADAGAITFDGSNDSLIGASITGSQPIHCFCVFKPISWTTDEIIYTGKGAATMAFKMKDGGSSPEFVINCGSAQTSDTGFALGTWALSIALFNGASSSLAINNDAPSGGSPGTGDMATFFILGANAVNPPSSAWGNFAIAELLMYDAAIAGADLTAIKNYINDQYGLW